MLSVNATYAHTRGENLMRGLNLNGPVDGVRPDPTFANVVEVTGDASSRQNTLNIGASVNFNTGGSGPGGPMMMGGGHDGHGRGRRAATAAAPPARARRRRTRGGTGAG